jgi:hypothetical protein
VEDIFYEPLMIVAVVIVVIIAVVGHIVIAIASPSEANADEDERDNLIEMRADQVSGYVLAVPTFVALGLAMLEVHWFWIANVLLAGFVLSEVIKSAVMLARYRRGF